MLKLAEYVSVASVCHVFTHSDEGTAHAMV